MKNILIVASFLVLFSCAEKQAPNHFIISNEKLHAINKNIFGHFLEKASWDNEIGGDLVIDTVTGQFDSIILSRLRDLSIPIIRYPGGTDVDYYLWYDLIDTIPGKQSKRNNYCFRGNGNVVSDNRLGLHEFIDLCDTINTEPLLVVNLGQAFFEKEKLSDAVKHAAALVSYCNKEKGYTTPDGMDWPMVRELNGDKSPFKIKYFEVGNEPWLFKDLKMKENSAEIIAHYIKCLQATISAMKAVDSSIVIITDGGIREVSAYLDSINYKEVDYLAYHPYLPWQINAVIKGSDTVDVSKLTAKEIWNAWVSTPNIDSITGENVFVVDDYYQNVYNTRYNIALTEWNWNGWWSDSLSKHAVYGSKYAKGIGAAGFIHAMMRGGDRIKMGCQSMLVGKSWGITSIRVDSTGKNEPVIYPTGYVTGFYAANTGKELVKVEALHKTFFKQPYKINYLMPSEKVANLDVMASKDDDYLYIHIINRNFDAEESVSFSLDGFTFEGDIFQKIIEESDEGLVQESSYLLETKDKIEMSLAPKSIHVLKIKLKN